MTSTTTAELATTAAARPPLAIWLKEQWTTVNANFAMVPGSIRSAWEQVGERLRDALDLPTRQEIAQLSTRLDDLDARLASLLEARAAAARPLLAPPVVAHRNGVRQSSTRRARAPRK